MVEDVLVLSAKSEWSIGSDVVLILVVVEDVLVLKVSSKVMYKTTGLNPCCGGRCSSTRDKKPYRTSDVLCLNPCCGGRCSSTPASKGKSVLPKKRLNPCCGGRCSSTTPS